MISIVRNNQIINLLILVPYTFIVRAHSLIYPQLYEIGEDDSFLAKWIFSWLGENALLHSIISVLLVYAIAVIVAVLANKYRLFQRQNLFSAYFFVLLASLISEIQVLSPVLIALGFFTLYIRSCMMIYRNHLNVFEIFNMGLFALLSGMLYPPFMMLIIASFFVILFFEGFDVKAFLLLILGVLAMAIIIYSFFYFFDIPFSTDTETLGMSRVLSDGSYWVFDRILYVSIVMLLMLFGLSSYYTFLKKKIIDARKRITFLFLITILMSVIPFLFVATDIYFLLVLALLGSLFIAFYLDGLRNNVLVETIHLILIIILFGFQFSFINI